MHSTEETNQNRMLSIFLMLTTGKKTAYEILLGLQGEQKHYFDQREAFLIPELHRYCGQGYLKQQITNKIENITRIDCYYRLTRKGYRYLKKHTDWNGKKGLFEKKHSLWNKECGETSTIEWNENDKSTYEIESLKDYLRISTSKIRFGFDSSVIYKELNEFLEASLNSTQEGSEVDLIQKFGDPELLCDAFKELHPVVLRWIHVITSMICGVVVCLTILYTVMIADTVVSSIVRNGFYHICIGHISSTGY